MLKRHKDEDFLSNKFNQTMSRKIMSELNRDDITDYAIVEEGESVAIKLFYTPTEYRILIVMPVDKRNGVYGFLFYPNLITDATSATIGNLFLKASKHRENSEIDAFLKNALVDYHLKNNNIEELQNITTDNFELIRENPKD